MTAIYKKHFAVLDEFFKHGPNRFNQTRSYMAIYPNATANSAVRAAYELFNRPEIIEEVQRRYKEIQLSIDDSLAILGDQAYADMGVFLEVNERWTLHPTDFEKIIEERQIEVDEKEVTEYLAQSVVLNPYKIVDKSYSHLIKTYTNSPRSGVKLELYDKQNAIDKSIRVQGGYKDSDEKIESGRNLLVSIPADLVASDFLEVYRDIRYGNSWEYPLDGGRGSLKSTFATEVIIELMLNSSRATEDKSKWMHALGLRQVEKTIRESIFRQFQWSIEKLSEYNDFSYSDFKFTYSPLEITYIPTQQKIYFRGGDDPMNIKSIKPQFGYIGLLLFEEFDQFRGQEAVRSIVQSAFRGGDRAYRFECWNTPRTKAHWVNKYLEIPKEGRFHKHTTYLNVPREWLGKIFFDEANHLKEVNPTAYEHEYLGVANGTGGMVFENVEIREITDEEIATFNGYSDGIDWGYIDPFVWGRSYYNPNTSDLFIYDEYYASRKANDEAFAVLYGTRDEKGNIIEPGKGVTFNDLIIADSAEPKSIADFRQWGANIRGAEKGPGSINYRIKWLQTRRKIIIDPVRAPHHAEEFLNYELEQTKDGEFITSYPDKDNHCIDTTGYAHNLIWRVRGQ